MPALLRRHDLPLRLRLRLIFHRYWYRLRNLQSPLHLRYSLARLRHNHPRPWLALLRLFIPYPTWHFPIPPPLSPQDLLGNEDLIPRYPPTLPLPTHGIHAVRRVSPMGTETEYFWYQSSWSLQRIPDPEETDPIRYVVLASLVEELVTAFNWRLGLGMRQDRRHVYRERNADPYPPYEAVRGPEWTGDVAPIERERLEGLSGGFVRDGCRLVLEEKGVSETFGKRNVVTNVGWLYTI
ncbi:hypothetical protein FQN50_000234 [Emmonsiellopsis sp. PD_5]|nr:hypothetical protein FQN50_000234 [Emmonsiellopsis sp. PD_5]